LAFISVSYRMTTILDYIRETESVCLDILHRREDIAKPFINLVSGMKIDELVILGSGTSCHAAMVAKPFMEKLCHVHVTAAFPTIYNDQHRYYPECAIVIGVSQSGNSTSTRNALVKAKDQGLPTVLLTSNPNSRINDVSDAHIDIACGSELAVAKTKGYQASIMTILVCALEWAHHTKRVDDQIYLDAVHRLDITIRNLPRLIEESEAWYVRVKPELESAEHIMVLGNGNQLGTVWEGSLKLVETVRIPVVGYEVEEFMHGIYNAIKPDTYLFYIAHPNPIRERAVKLHDYLNKRTSHQFIVGSNNLLDSSSKDCALSLIDDDDFCGLEYIIPFQVMCHYLPPSKGINPFISGDPEFHATMSSKVI
jgi:glucoselysine-6-phosphate deglycase